MTKSVAVALFFTNEQLDRLQELWIAMCLGVLGGGEAEVSPLRGFAKLPRWQGSRDRRPHIRLLIGLGLRQMPELRSLRVFMKPCDPIL